MAFACPHCGKPGISPVAKLIAAGATWYGWSATCRSCGQRARIAGTAVRVQFGIFVLGLASIPWLIEAENRLVAGYVTAAAMLAVGLFAPLRKDLTS